MQKVAKFLKEMRDIPGVENVTLSQRDGAPIKSVGVWLTRNEIFGVCSSTAAIFSVAEKLHNGNLNDILIEGGNAKILVAPIHNSGRRITAGDFSSSQSSATQKPEYFVALSASPKTSLGKIYVSLRKVLPPIKEILDDSDAEYLPPLRNYSVDEVREIFGNFSTKEEEGQLSPIDSGSLLITTELRQKIAGYIRKFTDTIPGVEIASVTLDGGYELINYSLHPHIRDEGVMSYSLFDASKRQIYMLKNTVIHSVTCKCKNYSHYIYYLDGGVFSAFISRKVRLGLVRMAIKQYLKTISECLADIKKTSEARFNLGGLLKDFHLNLD